MIGGLGIPGASSVELLDLWFRSSMCHGQPSTTWIIKLYKDGVGVGASSKVHV